MSEHRIRLRGGWEWHGPASGPAATRRVSLPLRWPAGLTGPVRLVRRFGCPPIDPSRERLALCLERVPGLLAVRLNDRGVEPPAEGAPALRLEPILANNVLVLDVDPVMAAACEDREAGWGEIALVVGAIEDTGPERRAGGAEASP